MSYNIKTTRSMIDLGSPNVQRIVCVLNELISGKKDSRIADPVDR